VTVKLLVVQMVDLMEHQLVERMVVMKDCMKAVMMVEEMVDKKVVLKDLSLVDLKVVQWVALLV
jgi:hypothetical protein